MIDLHEGILEEFAERVLPFGRYHDHDDCLSWRKKRDWSERKKPERTPEFRAKRAALAKAAYARKVEGVVRRKYVRRSAK
jgi:hypothetical protein